jgi:hypothetical protein
MSAELRPSRKEKKVNSKTKKDSLEKNVDQDFSFLVGNAEIPQDAR